MFSDIRNVTSRNINLSYKLYFYYILYYKQFNKNTLGIFQSMTAGGKNFSNHGFRVSVDPDHPGHVRRHPRHSYSTRIPAIQYIHKFQVYVNQL